MNKPYTLNLPAPAGYRFESFDLTASQRQVMATAMEVAQQMRQEGDSAIEDATRAVILLRGAGQLWAVTDDEPDLQGDHEIDRYVNAYMDGVAELMARVPMSDPSTTCTCQHGC